MMRFYGRPNAGGADRFPMDAEPSEGRTRFAELLNGSNFTVHVSGISPQERPRALSKGVCGDRGTLRERDA
ncbi:MAG: hypothetical protein ACR2JC_08120 [Chloroflexota bacterium]|nr:MAG: hypothetical protein DLM70_12700 [Chloroflexota bacterium]